MIYYVGMHRDMQTGLYDIFINRREEREGDFENDFCYTSLPPSIGI